MLHCTHSCAIDLYEKLVSECEHVVVHKSFQTLQNDVSWVVWREIRLVEFKPFVDGLNCMLCVDIGIHCLRVGCDESAAF